ncbi:MAG: amidohydrolase [Saprospiraceae bacterium]|nr:amidohydrolase [Saprospiraceae bacterium]
MSLKNKILHIAQKHTPTAITIRQHLHQYPELSYQEFETGKYIAQQLQSMGIEHSTGWANTGVVAIIQGKLQSKKITALRADIDALPIHEVSEIPYKSKNEGVMHACGHDVHTASLLGAAKILNDTRDEWGGKVKLIFQPAEEKLPGGASLLIKEGVLKNPAPTNIIGQHVYPLLPAGIVGFKSGVYMASADEIYVSVKGRGGHGAVPQNSIDPVVLTANIITALQQIVSRFADPTMPSVLTFGKINSTGGSTNIIPNEVKLEGTFRTLNEKWRKEAHRKMKKMAEGIAKSMGGTCEFNIVNGYPVLINDAALTARAKKYAIEFAGKLNVTELPLRMTAEDFAYYSQQIPACFYRLGTASANGENSSGLHTNTFNIDENCMPLSIGLLAWMAVKELGN